MERINPDLNALCGPMFIFFLALTALRSLGAGKQDRLASKLPEGTAIHAADRPAAEEGASSTKPAPSNQGPENPSQQPQQHPQSSSHVSPGAFEPAMAQRSIRRLPGKTAPTSENYSPDSVYFFTLQVMWDQCNFAGNAAFRVYVAIGAVLNAAGEYAEQLKHPVKRVGFLSISRLENVDFLIKAMPFLLFSQT